MVVDIFAQPLLHHKKASFSPVPNISRSKGYQAIKIGKLGEYNVRDISIQKWGNKTSSRRLFVI